jgi:CRISPR/Cas system CMR-associated protein Cmr5 small subunit
LGPEDHDAKANVTVISTPPSKLKIQKVSAVEPEKKEENVKVEQPKTKPLIEEEVKKPEDPVKVEQVIAEPPKIEPVPEPIIINDIKLAEVELDGACNDTEMKVKAVLESSKASINATRHHMALVRSLIDDTPKDEKRAWNEVFEAAAKKLESMQLTDKCLSEAKASLNDTINAIEQGRKSAQDSEALKVAEQRAAAALGELENVVSSLDSVKKEAKLIDEYRNLVEESRQQFEKEIEAILPGSSLSQKSAGGALSEEELNIFMTHAYRYLGIFFIC